MTNAARGRALLTRRVLTALCTGAFALQIGCYSYLPVQSEMPRAAERMSVSINDRGRLALSDRIGPATDRIEGRYLRSDTSTVVLLVTRVVDMRGNSSAWTGEEVAIPRDAISSYQARPLSKPRTFALAAAVFGGLLALALSISLAVGAGSEPDPVLPPGGGTGQGSRSSPTVPFILF